MLIQRNLNCTNIPGAITYKHRSNFVKKEDSEENFHYHDGYEIFFLFSGDIDFFIEKKIHSLKSFDLIITKPYEVHRANIKSEMFYDRAYITFSPQAFKIYGPSVFNMLECFVKRIPGEQNIIEFTHNQLDEVKSIFSKIDSYIKSPVVGSEILMFSLFNQLLILINQAFLYNESSSRTSGVPESLSPVLDYIASNLQDNLTIENLSQRFHISRHYLPHLFKKSIGTSIHEYILSKRISKAKMLLAENHSVTEACILSGFNDYCHFISIFKKAVGVSPLKYKQKIKENM